MAPPPEYDKEPKAPDKSVTTVSNDDSKAIYNNIKEPPTNSEHRNVTAGANAEGEQSNKHVEALDDGQLRALLDEAITYKCPKDREGKSNLFKELLEEVEQDEQASEAAARGLGAARGARRGRARPTTPRPSRPQDLVAAMAGEAAPRRARAPAAPPASVSARALHGGSLPSGVDTSFMLGEEAARGGYLATVRCVNPPPLAERRVSAGDAGAPPAADDAPRRSKPSFPMTYTARATLEIGSGSVCSGRAVTTTTASNQVRTPAPRPAPRPAPPGEPGLPPLWVNSVNSWYEGLDRYYDRSIAMMRMLSERVVPRHSNVRSKNYCIQENKSSSQILDTLSKNDDSSYKFNAVTGANATVGNPPSTFSDQKTSDNFGNVSKKCLKNIGNTDDNTNICEIDERPASQKNIIENETNVNRNYSDNHKQLDSITEIEMKEIISAPNVDDQKMFSEVELVDIRNNDNSVEPSDSFSDYVTRQQKLIKIVEINKININANNNVHVKCDDAPFKEKVDTNCGTEENFVQKSTNAKASSESLICPKDVIVSHEIVSDRTTTVEQSRIPGVANNAFILLTLPTSFDMTAFNDNFKTLEITGIENNTNNTTNDADENESNKVSKRKRSKENRSKSENLNRNILKKLLYSDTAEVSERVKTKSSPSEDREVDAAIPFSCISSPEVVAGCSTTASAPPPAPAADPKPRSVVSSTFNGLPLSRPGCGAAEEYKKSLDENGNAVQGFGSPLSGSGQQKKPRRKKSSKNETVIKSHQIDGYQGNKDLNEVLRFIESNAEGARAPHKLGRVKHRDDADDKGKKRSSERRKDRDGKPERASSLDERARPSRAERAARAAPPPAPPERRSWGDGAPPAEPPEPELADFQTVTKRRKPRRHEREPEPPRRARPPSPARAPPSAPPSDRSNDSNDDMDSVTSLPAAPPPPPPHASYADIARTRHNIPDLIESCNFYAEGEAEAAARPAPRARKERAEPAAAPAPDVVGERRPAVVLRPGARAPELDGVTFGFDVNEQLLGARVDLLRGPRCAPLRYEPPAAPPDAAQLLRVVAYVAAAWDDVVRCGGGAVRYFSE
ncbi:uncharacterized protein LOC123663628 [Melitaea cinxia]|uniref:uncharacterized protein LOC123663628 n=1 Tax=Melitaea cinxia TaxID=113334 RepID=UPI001E273C6E|nr:uncharacterized protein LOC123663628 [Melitaea cinxia]